MAVVSDDVAFHTVTTAERVEGAAAFRAHAMSVKSRAAKDDWDEKARPSSRRLGIEVGSSRRGWVRCLRLARESRVVVRQG
jgi:hypothetical protein